MNLARHSITSTDPVHIIDARFDPTCHLFTATTRAGYAVYRTCPLELIRKREFTGGTLAAVVPLDTSNILFLLGGGPSPLYSPNKVIVWDDALGREVAELEFNVDVKGIACRRGWLAVALRRRVAVFQIGEDINRYGEWDTYDNPKGLIALATAPHSTLLAIVGLQKGYVQLLHLPPCVSPAPRSPPAKDFPRKPPPPMVSHPAAMIAAHRSTLATLSIPPSGKFLATTSKQGTLVRVWDADDGRLVGEYRRGVDKAEIYGVAFRQDEKEICVWSDKGTIHAFTLGQTTSKNRQSKISPLGPFIPIPVYFKSEWSYAQYHIPVQAAHISLSSTSIRTPQIAGAPDEERCIVCWVHAPASDQQSATGLMASAPPGEYQLIALTYAGGWYRLSLPKRKQADQAASPPLVSQPPSAAGSTYHGSPRMTPLSLGSPSSKTSFGTRDLQVRPRTSSGSTAKSVTKGKDKEKERGALAKEGQDCTLREYRRFGRWDGWG